MRRLMLHQQPGMFERCCSIVFSRIAYRRNPLGVERPVQRKAPPQVPEGWMPQMGQVAPTTAERPMPPTPPKAPPPASSPHRDRGAKTSVEVEISPIGLIGRSAR